MGDHDGVDGVLGRVVGVPDAVVLAGARPVRARIDPGLATEYVPARVNRAHASKRLLETLRKRVEGGAHAGEEGVAPGRRNLPREEDRAAGGFVVVGVIGVPAAADVDLLVGFLQDLGDLRVALHRVEEAVDVDRAEALGEGDVVFGFELLAAKEDDPVFAEGAFDGAERVVVDLAQVDSVNLGAHSGARMRDFHDPRAYRLAGDRVTVACPHASMGPPRPPRPPLCS